MIAPVDPAVFWPLVDRRGPDDCWLWVGPVQRRDSGDRGIVWSRDGQGKRVREYAYRMAWLLTHGSLPAKPRGLLHRCDQSLCCNPAHLKPGTRVENNRERGDRNRTARGEAYPQARLTELTVRRLRRLYETGNYTKAELADRAGVSRTAAAKAISRTSWTHID